MISSSHSSSRFTLSFLHLFSPEKVSGSARVFLRAKSAAVRATTFSWRREGGQAGWKEVSWCGNIA